MTKQQLDDHMPTPVGLMYVLFPIAICVAAHEGFKKLIGKK